MTATVGRALGDGDERTAVAALTAVAGYGIPGSLAEPPTRPLRPDEWRRFVAEAHHHRLDGLLGAAVDGDRMPVTTTQLDETTKRSAAARTNVLRLEVALLDVVDRLMSDGVDSRVLAGSATAHLDYSDRSHSTFREIDLLVRPGQLDRSVALLNRCGYRTFSASRDRVAFRTPDGVDLCLHRRILPASSGRRIPPDALWARSETFDVGGHTAHALDREWRLVHACCRATPGNAPTRLATLRDVAEAGLHLDLDASRALAIAADAALEHRVADAVRQAWSRLRLADVVVLSTWAQSASVVRARHDAGHPSADGVEGTHQPLLARLGQRVRALGHTATADEGGGR